MPMKTICWISLLVLFFCCTLSSPKKSQLQTDSGYFIDSCSSFGLEDIKDTNFYNYKINQNLSFGYNNQMAVWTKLICKNNTTERIENYLCFRNIHLDTVQFYKENKISLQGDRTNQKVDFLEVLAFPIKLEPGEQKTYYFRIKKITAYLDFSYELFSPESLKSHNKITLFLITFFAGSVFILLILNFILYRVLHQKMYLWYILHSLFSLIYIGVTSGFARYLLPSSFLHLSELRIYSGCISFIFLSSFINEFLELKNNQNTIHKLLNWHNLINLGLVLLSLPILLFEYNFTIIRTLFSILYLNFLLSLVWIILAAVKNFKIDKLKAWYICLSFLPHFTWTFAIIFKSFGFIPREINMEWVVHLALYEILFFGYLLSRNFVNVFNKNIQYSLQLTKEKENTVLQSRIVQERERQKIANYLHDFFGANLAHVQQLLVLEKTKEAKKSIADISQNIREFSHQIMPKAIEEGLLINSLETQINFWNNNFTKTHIKFFHYDFPLNIKEKWVSDIFLISIELINNAQKHAAATQIQLDFFAHETEYIFQFSDNGIGFDPTKKELGFGLENIKSRIEYFKGNFSLSSSPKKGTHILINIPK